MKKFLLLIFIAALNINFTKAQDTFSICAIDTLTGEVGSAGASCVNNCTILTDVHPGYGVVHTQASWLSANQNYARSLMDLGLSPQAIIDSLVLHDAQNNPTIRQYGIVDLVNGGRVAAYTGVNCLNYKSHITGPTYSIQGNILMGQSILDSMESRFLNTEGTLAQKLMAALQGANVIGADTRCASWNTSSKSAFLRVARPGDTTGVLTLNIQVLTTPFGIEPIDSLQALFNNWLTSVNTISTEVPENYFLSQNFPNPFNPNTNLEFWISKAGFVSLKVYNSSGKEVAILVNENKSAGRYSVSFSATGGGIDLSSGIYYYSLRSGNFTETKRMVLLK